MTRTRTAQFDDDDLFPIPSGDSYGPGEVGDSDPYAPDDYPISTWVVIDGVKVPCTVDDLAAGQLTVLDGLSFSWGRDSAVDQPDTNTCAFTLREQDPEGTAENLYPFDPGFEQGPLPWDSYDGAAVTLDPAHAHSGSFSMHLSGGTAPAWAVMTLPKRLKRGGSYVMTMWCWLPEGSTDPVMIRYDPASAMGVDSRPSTTVGQWEKLTFWFNADNANNDDRFYIRSTNAGGEVWIDDITLVENTFPVERVEAQPPSRQADYTFYRTAGPDVNQGVASDGTYYYTIGSGSTRLTKYDRDWRQIATRDISADVTGATTTHVSAPLALNGYIYCPVHNDPRAIIARWRADDLSFVDQIMVTGNSDMASAALGWDEANQEFIIPGFYSDEETLQRFDPDFNYLGSIPTDITQPQGVFVYGDRIYVHGDRKAFGTNTRGLISILKDGSDPVMEIPEPIQEPEGCCIGPGNLITLALNRSSGGKYAIDEYAIPPITVTQPGHDFDLDLDIHVGSKVEVWSQAAVPVANSEVMQQTGFDQWNGQALPDDRWISIDNEQPDPPRVSRWKNSDPAVWIIRQDQFAAWTPQIAFPPAPFVTDGSDAQPAAWDLVPRLLPGQSWTCKATVYAPPGTKVSLTGWAYSGPHPADRVKIISATGGHRVVTGSSAQMLGDGTGWFDLQATFTLPDDLTDPAGYWIVPGLLIDPLPSPLTWTQTAGRWDQQVLRWIDLQRVGISYLSLLQAEASIRPALVWSGEVTSLVMQAAGYKAATTAVTASDLSSVLANVKVGDDPWPSQTVQERANAIMALIPTSPPLVIDPGLQNTVVSYRDVDAQPPLGLLQDLAQTAGGVLWITAHATQGVYLWMEDPRNRENVRRFAIDDTTGAVYITNDAGDQVSVAILSANDVLRDPVQWTQDVNQIITQASISWLEQIPAGEGEQASTEDHTVVVRDTQDRIDRYGIRDISVSTELTTAEDAENLADRILALSRGTGWIFDGLQLDTILLCRDIATVDYPHRLTTVLDLLDATTRIGYALTLIDMPAWTPTGAVRSVYVDGGTYTWADHRWQLELTATPSAGQGQSATWADFDGTGVTWADFAPNKITWLDAYGTAGPTVQAQLEGAE